MSVFISNAEKNEFKNSYKLFFDTFKEDIKIHKQGKSTVVNLSANQDFGYDEPANTTNYTHSLENSIFSALVIYPAGVRQTSDAKMVNEIRSIIFENQVLIRVEELCKNYLITGIVGRIDIKNKSYKLISRESEPNRILNGYFIFKLEETK